jgi:hypothetical protein
MPSTDPAAPIFFAAVKHHLTSKNVEFYTPSKIERVIEADALNPDVFWVSGKALLRYDDILETMREMINDSHVGPGTIQ